ncbi:MAG: hypothetical protein WC455_26340 [Dehalococcoidia bacterium]|jgi:hypothetical protein
MTDRIKEIEERLENASPGPWHACDEGKLLGEKISLSNQITALKAELADALTNQDARRMSLAQEIAEALKVRGHWVPKDYASAELINAVGMALDELADARGRLEAVKESLEEMLAWCDDSQAVASYDNMIERARQAIKKVGEDSKGE